MVFDQLDRPVQGIGLEDGIASDIPRAGRYTVPTTLLSPSGEPRSVRLLPVRCAHAIHASIPAFICSGVPELICSAAETFDR